MSIVFHDADNDHAPFPHRILHSSEYITKICGMLTIVPARIFVICAECDHWIMRPGDGCDCEQQCHQQARELGSATTVSSI